MPGAQVREELQGLLRRGRTERRAPRRLDIVHQVAAVLPDVHLPPGADRRPPDIHLTVAGAVHRQILGHLQVVIPGPARCGRLERSQLQLVLVIGHGQDGRVVGQAVDAALVLIGLPGRREEVVGLDLGLPRQIRVQLLQRALGDELGEAGGLHEDDIRRLAPRDHRLQLGEVPVVRLVLDGDADLGRLGEGLDGLVPHLKLRGRGAQHQDHVARWRRAATDAASQHQQGQRRDDQADETPGHFTHLSVSATDTH